MSWNQRRKSGAESLICAMKEAMRLAQSLDQQAVK
jgi:hypothetical protein